MMKFNKAFLALAVSSTLVACGGGSSGIAGVSSPTGGAGAGGGSATCVDTFVETPPELIGGVLQSTISGRACENVELSSGIRYILGANVFIGGGDRMLEAGESVDPVILSILPGADIRGIQGTSIIVTRGSRIEANGLRDNPITFSSLDDNFDGQQEWGGIVVQGFAPQTSPAVGGGLCSSNGATCNVQGEGGDFIGFYGGTNAADNSGTFRYVRIAEGGAPTADPGNEINGLTLQGVGYGTTVEFVQVHNNRDDGIEWFGGTVNAKYLVLTNNDDDDIDFDEGYVGNIQHALVIKDQVATSPVGSNDPRGIEANSDGTGSVSATEASLSNVTIVGGTASGGQDALRLRGGVTVNLYNTVLDNYQDCLRAEDGEAFDTSDPMNITRSVIAPTDVNLTNVLGDCFRNYVSQNDTDVTIGGVEVQAVPTEPSNDGTTFTNSGDVDGDGSPATLEGGSVTGAPSGGITLTASFAAMDPVASLPALVAPTPVGNSGFTFDATDYAGAVDPDLMFDPMNPGALDGTGAGVWWAVWTLPGTVDVSALNANTDN